MKGSPVRYIRRTVWEDLTPEQVVERYATGASLHDLGILTGTSAYMVRRVLVAARATIRPATWGGPGNPRKYMRKP
jgi:hypothetical protein